MNSILSKPRSRTPWSPARRFQVALLTGLLWAGALLTPPVPSAAVIPDPALRFEGNQALGESDLRRAAKRELTVLKTSDLKAAAADDAAFAMNQAYRERGYAFATVTYRFPTAARDETIFNIEEGPRVTLEKIMFSGNNVYPENRLLAFFSADHGLLPSFGGDVFVPARIEAALSAIRDLYRGDGYGDVKIAPPVYAYSADRSLATVRITLAEGVPYEVREIQFGGDLRPETSESLATARAQLLGKAYFKRRETALQNAVQEAYADTGYPDAAVTVTRLPGAAPGHVILRATIASGPRVRISSLEITGNEYTDTAFIANRILLHPGEYYRVSQERESFRRLYGMGLFKQVDLGLSPNHSGGEGALQVRVVENLPRSVSIQPGWGTYELLRGQVGYVEKSLFRSGRPLRAVVAASFKGESADLNVNDPWIFETETSADYSVFYHRLEEPSFTRREYGAALIFGRSPAPGLNLTAGYSFRRTSDYDIRADADLSTLLTVYNIGAVTLKCNYDTRTDPFYPTQGQSSFLSLEASGPALGSELSFYRVRAETRWFHSLLDGTVLALRYHTGLLIPGPDQFVIPLSERFFSGGETSVRSLPAFRLGPVDPVGNAVGGLGSNVFNLELRQRLIENLAASVFFDCGNIAPNQSRTQLGVPTFLSRGDLLQATLEDYFSDFRPAVGAGVQYLLPIGPARVDAGFNPWRRADRNEPFFQIAFSIGMAF